jgi:hypothetical protein
MQTLEFYRFRSVVTSRHKLIMIVDQRYLQYLVTSNTPRLLEVFTRKK